MFDLKKLKIVKELKSFKPRLKWLMFSQVQDYKINSNYVDMICSDKEKTQGFNDARLEAMVRDTLIKEFSPDIQNMRSYDLLVDAVVHSLKKKDLQEQETQDEEVI